MFVDEVLTWDNDNGTQYCDTVVEEKARAVFLNKYMP